MTQASLFATQVFIVICERDTAVDNISLEPREQLPGFIAIKDQFFFSCCN